MIIMEKAIKIKFNINNRLPYTVYTPIGSISFFDEETAISYAKGLVYGLQNYQKILNATFSKIMEIEYDEGK